MPGINLVFSWNEDIENWSNLFSKSQHLVKHNDQYRETLILSNRRCIIGCTKYESYPLHSFDFNNYKIIVDGVVYNKDVKTIQSELSHIASFVNSDSANFRAQLKEWLLASDGEYNVLFYDFKKQELSLFNDVLGRLSLYYYKNDRILVISREINFITPFVSEIAFEKDTLAEYLLFYAPLEDRTHISNVKKLKSAALMEVGGNNRDINLSRIHVFNLDEKKHAGKTVKQNAKELKNIFLDACSNRVRSLEQSKIIVSLSGGLDSRSVGAALKNTGATFCAATWLDHGKSKFAADAKIAKTIADILQVPWKLFQLPKTGISEIEKLLQYKGGLNFVGMNFILNFFESIKKEYGTNISYWTGDEGNASLGYAPPTKRLCNTDELVDYILDSRTNTKLERIKEYLDIDVRKLKEKIKDIVVQYPEQDLNNKYVHFFFEQLFKVQYEGEDRNRVFFWSVAPMYSFSFFDYALNIPYRQKKYHDLYREFLNTLYTEFAAINNAKWNYPVTARRRLLFREIEIWCFRKMPFAFRNIIRRRIPATTYNIAPELKEYLIRILKTSPTISDNFLPSGLDIVLNDRIYTESEFWSLLTIVAFINKTEQEYSVSKLDSKPFSI